MAYLYADDEPEREPLPSKEEVRAEIEDWKQRIAALFRTISAWLPDGWTADAAQTITVRERMMELTGVPAYDVPVLRAYRGGQPVLVFQPHVRWAYFTRGVVDVYGSGCNAQLVDKGAGPGDVRWTLRDMSDPKAIMREGKIPDSVPLTRDVMLDFLGRRT